MSSAACRLAGDFSPRFQAKSLFQCDFYLGSAGQPIQGAFSTTSLLMPNSTSAVRIHFDEVIVWIQNGEVTRSQGRNRRVPVPIFAVVDTDRSALSGRPKSPSEPSWTGWRLPF